MSALRSGVLEAKRRLSDAQQEFLRLRDDGHCGRELCDAVCIARDEVISDLFHAALAESGGDDLGTQVALVAHGGYGRRDVAPFSDVDLMLLHTSAAADRVAPLADRLLRDIFDSSLQLGHSVRTPEQACRLAFADASIYTSLIESRLLIGSEPLFERFVGRFRRSTYPKTRMLLSAIEKERAKERARYGETIYLLEPNVKRSRGGLRDLQLLRWIGFARYGLAEPQQLLERGRLTEGDFEAVTAALDFLLRLRNEMHLHAGQAADVLSRTEQVRLADLLGYREEPGLLPVEAFMRDYFRHTSQASHVVTRLANAARSRDRVAKIVTAAFGHRVEGGVRVGPTGLIATREGLKPLRGNLTEIMRLAALSNLYAKPIAPSTWEVVRREAARLPDDLPAEARHRFLDLLSHPARLGRILRDLHEIRVLERFIPQFEHARGLLQFNQYHKYTVDEHCLRAVEFATELADDSRTLGRVYRQIRQKHVLHLALLIHDLGKGHTEDHHELGRRYAVEVAGRLALPRGEAETLEMLVYQHNLMNHLALRRDTNDPQLVLQLAVTVGSPEVLQMLYVMTAADLGAVGPDVWDGWKDRILTDLYHRTMQHLAVDNPGAEADELLETDREAIRRQLGADGRVPWFRDQIDTLPAEYLRATTADQAAVDLRMLHDLSRQDVIAHGAYDAASDTCRYTVATREDVAPGIFHKLTGALTGQGLEIRSAQINTLAGDLVLDRFFVFDPDYAGQPPPHRIETVERTLAESLRSTGRQPPTFRRTWRAASGQAADVTAQGAQTRVQVDNSTSERFTILDIFAVDRPGLLHAITRTLFELDLSVWRAKIGTVLDQVVDVFYVTDGQGDKLVVEDRIEEIRRRLLEVTEAHAPDA